MLTVSSSTTINTKQKQQIHQGLILNGPLVLVKKTLIYLNIFIEDRIQTASRRSKPNSCNILIDEQSNPWKLLHHQDILNRHRGAKHFQR